MKLTLFYRNPVPLPFQQQYLEAWQLIKQTGFIALLLFLSKLR